MHFTKMHGIGNDYIYVNLYEEQVPDPAGLSRAISDRHFGVGSDGLVLIGPSQKADFRMQMFNNDGSEGRMCGNAARCIGKYVYEHGLTDRKTILLETESGIRQLDMTVENGKVTKVCVDMGVPVFEPERVPVRVPPETVMPMELPAPAGLPAYRGYCLSMGNPHAVMFVESVARIQLEAYGRFLQKNELFPESVNVEFAQVEKDGSLRMRVFERGSGETMACGTGACAVLAAAVLAGISPRENVVRLRGGDLDIAWREDGHIRMTGPAESICEGEWNR